MAVGIGICNNHTWVEAVPFCPVLSRFVPGIKYTIKTKTGESCPVLSRFVPL